MDSTAFDGLTRVLAGGMSRRGMTRTLGGLALGILALGPHPADAKKGGKKKSKKKSKNKGRAGQGQDPNSPQSPESPPPPPPPPPDPTCSDGIKNANETDIDCGGGTCPRCTFGKTCTSRGDCLSAFCSAGACQACVNNIVDCGLDTDGTQCACRDTVAGGKICTKQNCRFLAGGTCGQCVGGEQCSPAGAGNVECCQPCGA
jgi:hypothetical protein